VEVGVVVSHGVEDYQHHHTEKRKRKEDREGGREEERGYRDPSIPRE